MNNKETRGLGVWTFRDVQKSDNFQKNILSPSPPSHLLTLVLDSGYVNHSLQRTAQSCCVGKVGRGWICATGAWTPGDFLRQAVPVALVFVQWCSVNLSRTIPVWMKVRCCWGSLPVKTFTYVVYWFAGFIEVFARFLEPGLDSESSDNLCWWIIQAEWEAGPGSCWSTGADCWSGQK